MHHGAMDISYFAQTNARNCFRPFGIKQADRLSHVYALGKTGVGKSSLLGALARQDLAAGRGFCLIDPHGDLAEQLRDEASGADRAFVYLDAASLTQPYGYNPLHRVTEEKIPLAVSGLMDAMKKLWADAWGVRMEHVLRSSLYALIEREDSTLPDILRLYSDKAFRRDVVRGIRNETVRRYWKDEFEKYQDRQRAEAVAPIQNKLGALLTDPRLYRILVNPEKPLSFRRIMDTGGVLIVNLAKGRLGEDSANILGSMLASTIGLAGLSRAELPLSARRPFFLYVDEFQTFTTLAFATLMPELRKYGVGLILAHQYLHQLDSDVRHAVLGNAGTLVSFRLGPEDAGVIAQEMQPVFDTLDLLNLPNHQFTLKLMIDGAPSKPFSGRLV